MTESGQSHGRFTVTRLYRVGHLTCLVSDMIIAQLSVGG